MRFGRLRGAALAAILAVLPALTVKAHDAPHVARGISVATAPTGQNRQAPMPLVLGGPFSLVDHTGRPCSDADFRGAYMLIFFGYASCEGICPIGLDRMLGALDALGRAAARIQPVFISVAPAGDSPASLRAFVETRDKRLIGLTGSPAALRAVARSYRADAKIVGRFPDGKPIISHGSFVYLVGPDGRFIALFPPMMDPDGLAAAIRRYAPELAAHRPAPR